MFKNFKGYSFLIDIIPKLLAFIYLVVCISYKFDFKECPLNGKLDSVLWCLQGIGNVLKNHAFSYPLDSPKISNTDTTAFYQSLPIWLTLKLVQTSEAPSQCKDIHLFFALHTVKSSTCPFPR